MRLTVHVTRADGCYVLHALGVGTTWSDRLEDAEAAAREFIARAVLMPAAEVEVDLRPDP